MLEESAEAPADDPIAYVALAQAYSEADRGAAGHQSAAGRAGEVSRRQRRSPSSWAPCSTSRRSSRRRKRAFRQVLERDPENAAALNYLGYMLAERGERLDESVELSEESARDRARQRLVSRQPRLGLLQVRQARSRATTTCSAPPISCKTNSVIQDHYGDVLFKMGRYRRGDRRLDARARRRRRLDRSARHRQEDQVGEAKASEEVTGARSLAQRY